uniref:Uncharacterized protein n=1 Tax=Anopheles arabiensis TaxID=7173 RepID=A0A1Y9GLE9_ANOAR
MYSKIIVVLALVAAVSAQSQYGHQQHYQPQHDSTQGEYYLIDADGHKRTVTYHVEGKSGFIAEVHREPIKGYQAPQPQHHQYQPHHGASVHQNNHY